MKLLGTLVITMFTFIHGVAQQLHVKYKHIRSPIATLYEDLYIDHKKSISIQDSLITFTKQEGDEIAAVKKSDKSIKKRHFITNIGEENIKNYFFNAKNGDDEYFVLDAVPKINWKIDTNSKKNILGYECYKATGNYRGSKLIAYYATKIPVSAGPYKFFGLPGIILDIREENKNFNIWKAESITFSFDKEINFLPQFKDNQNIKMKDFVKIKEGSLYQDISKLDIPDNYVRNTVDRSSLLEKIYEWE